MIQNKKSILNLIILLFLFQIISCENVSNIENKVENIENLIQKLKKIEHIKIEIDSVLNFKTLTIKDTMDKPIVEYWLIPSMVFDNEMAYKKIAQRLMISSCINDSRFRQFTWKDFTFYPYCGNQIEDELSLLIFNAFESELIHNGAKLKHEYLTPTDLQNLFKPKKSNN
jgi:hypothetical protein